MMINRREILAAAAGAAGASFVPETPAVAQAAPAGAAPPGRVVVERLDPGILLIGVDRDDVQNRIDPAVLLGIGKAYYQLEHDDGLRVAVLYGRGANFVSGLDVPAFTAALQSGAFPPKDPAFIAPLNAFARTKPVVVAVHGETAFVGHELFLAADIRVASSNTRFRQAEVTRGVSPAGGGTIRFTREAGWGNAMRYMLTGDTWGADEAYRMGLVQEIAPAGKQLDRAIALSRKIAAAAPLGVRATLASAHSALAAEEATAFTALAPVFARLLQSEDARESTLAAQQNRAPVFVGR